MKRQRIAMCGGVLAAAVALMVTGVAVRATDGERQGTPARVMQLDGGGSRLGVMVSDVDDAARPGVRIDDVDEGSAAAKAGAKEGDLVVDFDGERVRSARQLTRLVQETPSGRAVKMTVQRGATRHTLDVTPEADAMFSRRVAPPTLDFRFDGEPGAAVPAFPGFLAPPAFAGRGRLGVEVEALSDQLATYFGVAKGGVLVSSVTKASTAEKAGLKAGDVITTVNGAAVSDARDLVDELSEMKDGAEVSLGIVRDKKPSTVKATLAAPERAPSRRSTRPA